MEIVTKNEGEAVALAAALQRLSPTPVVAGRIPAVRGGAVNGVTRMLANACLEINPLLRALGECIANGTVTAKPEPVALVKKVVKRKVKKLVKKAKLKAKKAKKR